MSQPPPPIPPPPPSPGPDPHGRAPAAPLPALDYRAPSPVLPMPAYPPPAAAAPLPMPAIPAYAFEPPPKPKKPPRPRMVVALGVLSIVVGSLSFLAYLTAAGAAVLFYFFPPDLPRAGSVRESQSLTISAPPSASPAPPADGLPEADRVRVGGVLRQLRPLSPPRREQLDAILARAGKRIFPSGTAAESVTGYGDTFSPDPSRPGADFFETDAGRLELFDDRAVFYPSDGSEAVRVSTRAAQDPASGGLSAGELQEAVAQAQQVCKDAGAVLNQNQLATIRGALASPSQRLVTTVGPLPLARRATAHPDGSVTVKFRDADLTVGVQGQLLPGPPRPPVRPGGAAVTLAAGAAVASAALAAYLLAAGVMALWRSKRAGRMHRVYAVAQAALAVVGAAAFWWMMRGYAERRFEAGADWAGPGAAGWALLLLVVACAYPACVWLALRTRAVREYYAPPREWE